MTWPCAWRRSAPPSWQVRQGLLAVSGPAVQAFEALHESTGSAGGACLQAFVSGTLQFNW